MGKKIKSADSAAGGDMAPGSGVDKAVRKAMEAVAKHMRYKIPTKSAIIKGQKVEYFSGSKAVDVLMDSKWTNEPKSQDSEEPHFVNRTFAVDYCNKLLRESFFVRAEKIEIKPREDPTEQPAGSSGKEAKGTLRKRGDKVTDSPREKKGDESANGEKKHKKKFRLDVHRQQVFVDTKEDVYFWRYDPPSYSSYMVGLAVVVGAIALTLQPLWPDSSREALWYFSVVVFFLMAAIVCLIVVRWIVYGTLLVLTGAKLKFWIFPNLDNEKTGFFESFKPTYSVEWVKTKKKKKVSSVITEEENDDKAANEKTSLVPGEDRADEAKEGGDENTTTSNDVSEPQVGSVAE